MSSFFYKAYDQEKKVVNGALTAKNAEEVAQILLRKNLSPLTIQEVLENTKINGNVSQIEKITFCRYLSTMLSSGLSLAEGLDVMKQDTKSKLMKKIIDDMSYSLEQGQQLSSVFSRYPQVFEPFFLILVQAGEVSGKLADVFKHLELQLRSEYSMMAKVKGALLYPAIVFIAMIGVGILLFFFVLPQIGKVFLSLRLPLPEFTKFMFMFSIYLSQNSGILLVFALVFLSLFFFMIRKKEFRDFLFTALQVVPLVRNLIKKVDLARFNRIFATLLKSAVPITDSVQIALDSMVLPEFRKIRAQVTDGLKEGKSIAYIIKNQKHFPNLMVQMMATGEKTGTLDVSLSDLAQFYEEEVEEELKNLTQIIEPVLMLLVGIGVGVMILSIIAPIYSVVGNFQSAAGPTP